MKKTKKQMDKLKANLEKSALAKSERFRKAMAGDCDAIVECMYHAGMCDQEALKDYYRIKEEYGED